MLAVPAACQLLYDNDGEAGEEQGAFLQRDALFLLPMEIFTSRNRQITYANLPKAATSYTEHRVLK
ncbi:hypothetical protein GCM10010918_53120 [Paenibacillus radicis (ex Gao et al. 2016)]|uniref:Uncharacterized protein n=1 Tax=Paenibacillus radicis (ex Gao et al. 2016) TaxID=1737354 RepID=A0A917HSN8_9BACL|nr:hypothetical protein GCM10010918_53120 [Paenibacillus radicis (ex Gao et al. 2016)]